MSVYDTVTMLWPTDDIADLTDFDDVFPVMLNRDLDVLDSRCNRYRTSSTSSTSSTRLLDRQRCYGRLAGCRKWWRVCRRGWSLLSWIHRVNRSEKSQREEEQET